MNDRIYPPMDKEIHHWTTEDKLKWWRYGEWIEEPDEIEFTYLGFECRIIRVATPEPFSKEIHVFGGNLCGYIRIPSDHPYHHKRYEEMDIQCHYGLTYGEVADSHWIGFDCAHLGDCIPSTEYLKKTRYELIEIIRNFPIPEKFKDHFLFNPTYKNVRYCVDECMDIVEQLIEIDKMSKI